MITSGGPLPIEGGGVVMCYTVYEAPYKRVLIEYLYVDENGPSHMSGYLSKEELNLEWWAPSATIHNDCKAALDAYFGISSLQK